MNRRPMNVLAVLMIALAPVATLAQAPAAREAQGPPSLAPLVESVKSAVVNVDVQARAGGRMGAHPREDMEDPFEDFFGRRSRPRGEQILQGAGSGFIVDPKGLVLTNNHVVEGAVAIRVRLDDGRSFEGEVLGRDPLTDVAVVKLKGKVENLPWLKLGDSDAMRVGDWVLAIGNPFGLASSVSMGIISARERVISPRPYDDFLQTDAAINPGNSGGPLFNMKGEVVGINTAIAAAGSGIGFAVPSNLAKALLPQLEKDGAVTRGYLGIGIQDLTAGLAGALGVPVSEGALVREVNQGSPAGRAGLKEDDAIVALDGVKIVSGGSLTRTVALKRPETQVTLKVYRGGKALEVKVVLGTRPDLEQLGALGTEGGSGKKEEGREQRVGLKVQDMDPRMAQAMNLPPEGALITEVSPGSASERAELSPGMVIVEAGRKPVRGAGDLLKAIKAAKPGTTLLLRVHAQGGGGRMLRALTLP